MGIFTQIKRSKEKTKVMAKLIDSLKDSRYSEETENNMRCFYDYICADYILGPIISKYNADYETVKILILDLDETFGGHFGGWKKGQYVPVCTFGFSKSLECALREYRNGSSIELISFEVEKLM